MGKQAANSIVIIGCGNVAWHLAKQLRQLNYGVLVYNHRASAALRRFSSVLGCKTKASLKEISTGAGFYFVCVSDSVISEVSAHIRCSRADAMVMHTSGSARLKDLKSEGGSRAVFYPLQTFSKDDELDWKEIPIVLEAADKTTLHQATALAARLSANIIYAKGQERLTLHLAAVMANNFTNALYVAADDLLRAIREVKGSHLLLPLIRQTTNKLGRMSPVQAQTGPAKRGDKGVMKKHLSLLEKQKDLQKLYRQMSELIIKQQKRHA